uniref:helix-turn-helix transcriptional regulator n=1 Tax=Methylobacterium sp. B34 TaxID=95563 RepID=UPI0003492EA4|nr:helix-turn-helix transcriptional regulator [Methylobacterium sp. B34]
MLNEALRLIRVYHDLRQVDVAEQLGISKSYLSEIEKGSKKPTLDLMEKYSKNFQIPVSSIMFFSENIDNTKAYEKARGAVAAKIIKLMQFLEERGGPRHAD